jgi:hypothetical protein
MGLREIARARVKAGRKSGARWVGLLDLLRGLSSANGRSIAWTRFFFGDDVHQTTTDTMEERYPELFDVAAQLGVGAERILSFGCSTGEELAALRRRFPQSLIVGAEINRRARTIARRRTAGDPLTVVMPPSGISGSFDLIFALAVFQREPHRIAESELEDLSCEYPFERFDKAVSALVDRLRPRGLLCVFNAHYRIEDSSAAARLERLGAPLVMEGGLFGPDSRRLPGATGGTVFRKV